MNDFTIPKIRQVEKKKKKKVWVLQSSPIFLNSLELWNYIHKQF